MTVQPHTPSLADSHPPRAGNPLAGSRRTDGAIVPYEGRYEVAPSDVPGRYVVVDHETESVFMGLPRSRARFSLEQADAWIADLMSRQVDLAERGTPDSYHRAIEAKGLAGPRFGVIALRGISSSGEPLYAVVDQWGKKRRRGLTRDEANTELERLNKGGLVGGGWK